MTKKELSINITWDEFEIGTCRLFIETLNQYIPTLFFQDHKPKPRVSNTMLQAVNDILSMDIKEFENLKRILKSEVFRIKEIHIDQDNESYDGVYSEVIVDSEVDLALSVVIKNGKFDSINDGSYFDNLEVAEKKKTKQHLTQEEREKMIAMLDSE